MDFFSTQNILVHIPIGAGGYDLSWIEAVGTIAGLLCIWLASLEKISNYAFGLVNVTLFAIIFFQIQLYASLLLQLFFFAANVYGWYAWSRQSSNHEAELQIRWLPRSKALGWLAACVVAIGLLTLFINPFFAFLTRIAVSLMQALGLQVTMPELQPDAFPFWDSCMTVLSVVAMILENRTVQAYSSSRTVKKQPDSTITARITTAIKVTVLFFTSFLLLRCLPEFPEAGASACRCRCRY